ncbi:hypothetical protein EP164_10725 [Photorhabdus luminescens subsp. sonorensis]|uniref:Ner winged helix-turn-helix DNA-binding domain-containing protein n=1 Tax=Photorhabdus luminescens subsp. sonorensis TaxID=1173677 RepID=A0A5C4RIL3_PHOLU|nr:hypothetical protein EP164_10725 [Photorhabdus luminescens subsp. sonorensis]
MKLKITPEECFDITTTFTLANTLSRPWPKGEWIIANYLEIHPSGIWPSRYFDMYGQLIERETRKEFD